MIVTRNVTIGNTVAFNCRQRIFFLIVKGPERTNNGDEIKSEHKGDMLSDYLNRSQTPFPVYHSSIDTVNPNVTTAV